MGAVEFGVPKRLTLWLRDLANLKVFVETGTNLGNTAKWASSNFYEVKTIEGDQELWQAARERFPEAENIEWLLGDSRERLGEVVSKLNSPTIFWLDAHWCGKGTFDKENECPLMEELTVINQMTLEHVILIDDARLFLAPPPLPHSAARWPDLTAVVRELTRGSRYVAVYRDVIVAVSRGIQAELVKFLQTVTNEQEPPFGIRHRLSLIKRAVMGK